MAINDLYLKLEEIKNRRAGCLKELELLKKEKEDCLIKLKKFNLTEETLNDMIVKIEAKLEEKMKDIKNV